MAEQEEMFIDIQKQIVVPIENKDVIVNNPEGLTVEGINFNIKQHRAKSGSRGGNKYIAAKYELMLKQCKNFAKSGKLSNGRTVLSRDVDGNVNWSEMIDENYNLIPQIIKPIEVRL